MFGSWGQNGTTNTPTHGALPQRGTAFDADHRHSVSGGTARVPACRGHDNFKYLHGASGHQFILQCLCDNTEFRYLRSNERHGPHRNLHPQCVLHSGDALYVHAQCRFWRGQLCHANHCKWRQPAQLQPVSGCGPFAGLGDGSGSTFTMSGTGSGLLTANNLTVYGEIPIAQDKPPGTYTSTITVTVAY